MKINKEFMLREVAGNYVIVPVGKADLNFKGIINLNETGAFIYKKLLEGKDEEEIKAEMMNCYDVTLEQATLDINKIITALKESGVIENWL